MQLLAVVLFVAVAVPLCVLGAHRVTLAVRRLRMGPVAPETAPPPSVGAVSAVYPALVEKVRERVRERLQCPGTERLARDWGADPLAGVPEGNRRQVAAEAIDEKIARERPDDRYPYQWCCRRPCQRAGIEPGNGCRRRPRRA